MTMLKRLFQAYTGYRYHAEEKNKLRDMLIKFCEENKDNPDYAMSKGGEYLYVGWYRGPFRIELSTFTSHILIVMHQNKDEIVVIRKGTSLVPNFNEIKVDKGITCDYVITEMLTSDVPGFEVRMQHSQHAIDKLKARK